MKKTILMMGLMFILGIYLVSAVDLVNIKKDDYHPPETASFEFSLDDVAEKNKDYSVFLFNNTATLDILYIYNGTTPNSVGEIFTESYDIPSGFNGGLSVNLTVEGTFKGRDNATVSSSGASDLLITDCLVAGNWLGLTSSVKCTVKDENDKLISGGSVKVSIWSNDATQMLEEEVTQMYNGELKASWELKYENFDEGVDYFVKVISECGDAGTPTSCRGSDNVNSTELEGSVGTTLVPFTTNIWITINEDPMPITYMNGTNYSNAVVFAGFEEEVFFRANLTNNKLEDVELEILTFLINNETGAIHQEPGARSRTIELDGGNNSLIGRHEITKDAQTGVYYIKKFYDVIYNNIVVAQGVVNTEPFNITGTDDSFKLNTVVTDKINYYSGEYVHICANVSSLFDKRIEFDVLYNIRCSESGLDTDTDRSIVGFLREPRELDAGTTQEQCGEVFVDYLDHLKYKTSICYASVTIESPYIDRFDNKLLVRGSDFNVTDYGYYPEYELNPTYPLVRLFPDWRRFDDLIDGVNRIYYRTKINISKLKEEFLDPDDNIENGSWDVYAICTDNMPISQEHYNFTVLNESGDVIDNEVEAKALQWVHSPNHGELNTACAIGIENVNFSDTGDDWFEVRIWYEDFEENKMNALLGINSSAGTLDFSILAADTSESTTIVKGSGRTGQGQIMNRDVRITCQVNGHPFTAKSFTVFATDTFSFEMEVEVPSKQSTYTMSCTAKDVKFGTFYSEAATDNFKKIYVLGAGAGATVERGEETIDKIKKAFFETTKSEWLLIAGIMGVMALFIFSDNNNGIKINEKGEII